MPANKPARARITHTHHLRPAIPAVDYGAAGSNGCHAAACPHLGTYVHTWRATRGREDRTRGKLLCRNHAEIAAKTHNLHVQFPPPESQEP